MAFDNRGGTLRTNSPVGAGLVGATVALGLARRGYSVVVVERSKPEIRRGKLGCDIRNVALSPASRDLLENIDVWRSTTGAAPYERMHVWEERGTKSMDFRAAAVGRKELGWVLEHSLLTTLLWQHLESESQIHIMLDEPLLGVHTDRCVVKLVTDGGDIEARLLIGADGGQSVVRELLGVAVESTDTGHHALATVVQTETPHENVAYQRFVSSGPIALLPSAHTNLSSVVWSQPPDEAACRRSLPPSQFCEELGNRLVHRLGAIEAVDERYTFPVQQMLVQSFNPHPRVVLIGDAARVLHPLAGLGVNLGFEDVRDVLDELTDQEPIDPGFDGRWKRFARRRRVRSQLLIGLMTTFRRVYAASDPWMLWARNVGIGWLDGTTGIKSQLMKEALGLGSVARGL